jgi:transposase
LHKVVCITEFSRTAVVDGREKVMDITKKKHISTVEAAEWLGYSVRTITGWAEQWHETGGREGIPGFKVGRAWRFDTGELQRWLDEKRIPYQARPGAQSG